MIEQSLIAFLKADPAVSTIVGEKIIMLVAAENLKPPLVVLFRAITRRTHTKTGPTGDVRVTFELHCVAGDPIGMATLGNAVRQALDGFRGDLAGVQVSYVGISDEKDAYEPEARLCVRILEGFIWYDE